jgi:hypothetical protein
VEGVKGGGRLAFLKQVLAVRQKVMEGFLTPSLLFCAQQWQSILEE